MSFSVEENAVFIHEFSTTKISLPWEGDTPFPHPPPSLAPLAYYRPPKIQSWATPLSLLSRDVPCECSISEGLAIVPLTRHRFQTKRGQFNGCLHARLHEKVLATENQKNRQAYSSAFPSKILYSRVICVFV